MKKILSVLLACAMLLALLSLSACGGAAGDGGKKGTLTLNVYNWGEYISDGSVGSEMCIRDRGRIHLRRLRGLAQHRQGL